MLLHLSGAQVLDEDQMQKSNAILPADNRILNNQIGMSKFKGQGTQTYFSHNCSTQHADDTK